MQCAACARAEPPRNGAWYCSSCISSRLKEYHTRRQQLKNGLTLVTANATSLLTGSRTRVGVEQERLLKAEKWTLASRAYAAREEVTRVKAQNQAATEQLEKRRQGIASRRANLATARSLLSNLETSVPSASSLSLPESIPALQARCAALQVELDTLEADSARARAILTQELVSVYGLRRIVVEQPLPDPFLTAPLAHSVVEPASLQSTSSTWRAQTAPEPIPPTYTLASLPLPRLSNLLSGLPSHAHLEALLSHLAYLIRLLALYEGVALPFVPLPSCFGAGRAGVRVAVGWGSAANAGPNTAAKRDRNGATRNPAREQDEGSSSTPTISVPSGDRPKMAVSEGDCFPLCFGSSSRKATTRRQQVREDHDGLAGETTATDEGSEDGHTDSRNSSQKLFQGEEGEEKGSHSRKKRVSTSSKRVKGVFLGAVALAFDLAYIAWRRSSRSGLHASTNSALRSRQLDWRDPTVLDDLGGLLLEAAGVSLDHDRSTQPISHGNAPELGDGSPPPFPLEFAEAAGHFLATVFPKTVQSSRAPRDVGLSDSLGESGVVVGLDATRLLDADDDDADEWDFVSV